jgi:prepilin-type N-terminal cleavage/methylation domain-containing protein
MPRHPAGSGSGFTMIELMVVMVIIAVIAAMVVPLAFGTSGTAAMATARRVGADLEYAQNLAITTQSNITVTFDTTANSYRVSNSLGVVKHPITQKDFTITLGNDPGTSGVAITSAFGAGKQVVFGPLGDPTPSGTVALGGGGSNYVLTVAAVTGRVSIAAAP